MTRTALLVSAGEASGDRMAALALQPLRGEIHAFGMGGAACALAGVELLADMRAVNAMGLSRVALKSLDALRAFNTLVASAAARRPRVALLVGNSAFNECLGRRLRARAIPVLWCAPPQVWAWGRWRLRSMRACVDRMAVTLPFEESLWRDQGYDAKYVGHPSVQSTRWGAAEHMRRLAVLCGSRDQEAERAGAVMLDAACAWLRHHHDWHADVLAAPSLSPGLRQLLHASAASHGIAWCDMDPSDGAAPLLHRYRLAFSVSGTATLEAALSGTPPVIGYRCDWLTAGAARLLVNSKHVGLPNIVLGRRAFPELLQRELTVAGVVAAGEALEANRTEALAACRALRDLLSRNDAPHFGNSVASMLREMI